MECPGSLLCTLSPKGSQFTMPSAYSSSDETRSNVAMANMAGKRTEITLLLILILVFDGLCTDSKKTKNMSAANPVRSAAGLPINIYIHIYSIHIYIYIYRTQLNDLTKLCPMAITGNGLYTFCCWNSDLHSSCSTPPSLSIGISYINAQGPICAAHHKHCAAVVGCVLRPGRVRSNTPKTDPKSFYYILLRWEKDNFEPRSATGSGCVAVDASSCRCFGVWRLKLLKAIDQSNPIE